MRRPPDPETFNTLVWTIVKQIPEGIVSTYGQIASMIPPPEGVLPPEYDRFGAIWVGQAMNATPPGFSIPWQRVINSQGKISIAEDAGGNRQRLLLEDEGVQFSEKGAVNFEIYGWDGPGEQWCREHGVYTPKRLKKKSPPEDGEKQMSLF